MEGEDFSVEAKSLTFRASPSPPVGSQRDSVRPQQQPYFHHFTLPNVLNSPCTFQQEKKNKTNCRKNVSSQLPSEHVHMHLFSVNLRSEKALPETPRPWQIVSSSWNRYTKMLCAEPINPGQLIKYDRKRSTGKIYRPINLQNLKHPRMSRSSSPILDV